jgi:hypothetical protein
MSIDGNVLSARDITLQKIGRNVVNFQKMEAMLKFVLTAANISGPIAKTESLIRGNAKRVRSQPMGHLVDKAATALHSDPPKPPPEIAEIWVSHSFSLRDGGSQLLEWRREMRRVVKERNSLIHKMLATWDPNSLDSTNALGKELDEQRERIISAYNHLESVVLAIRESHQELASQVDQIVSDITSARENGA